MMHIQKIEDTMEAIKDLEELAKNGHDVKTLIDLEKSRLRKAQEEFWKEAIFNQNLYSIKWLHEETGFDFNTPVSKEKNSSYPVSDAACCPNEIFEYVLNNTDEKILSKATIKEFPLIDYLLRTGRTEKVEKVLDKTKINTEQATSNLILAIKMGKWDMAIMFMEKGANIDYEVEGKSIKDWLNENKESYVKEELKRWGYKEKEFGRTGNSRTGEVSEEDKNIAKLRAEVTKAVMVANKKVRH